MPDMSMWSATQRLSVLWTQFAALHLISNVSFGLATAFLKELPLFSLKSPQHVQSVVSAAFPWTWMEERQQQLSMLCSHPQALQLNEPIRNLLKK
jgi:hypothetical protein